VCDLRRLRFPTISVERRRSLGCWPSISRSVRESSTSLASVARAYATSAAYQVSLRFGVASFIFDAPRTGSFFAANREGILDLFGLPFLCDLLRASLWTISPAHSCSLHGHARARQRRWLLCAPAACLAPFACPACACAFRGGLCRSYSAVVVGWSPCGACAETLYPFSADQHACGLLGIICIVVSWPSIPTLGPCLEYDGTIVSRCCRAMFRMSSP